MHLIPITLFMFLIAPFLQRLVELGFVCMMHDAGVHNARLHKVIKLRSEKQIRFEPLEQYSNENLFLKSRPEANLKKLFLVLS